MHTFDGTEDHVYVSDLPKESRQLLNIPKTAREKDKVYNYNFYENYNDLRDEVKTSNEAVTLSLAKAISSYLCIAKGASYSEQNVVDMLTIAIFDLSYMPMKHILESNHNTWFTLSYARGGIEPDIEVEFYNQTDTNFLAKDLGTVMPSILFSLAILGIDPVTIIPTLTYPVWGIAEVAQDLRKHMAVSNKNTQKVVNE